MVGLVVSTGCDGSEVMHAGEEADAALALGSAELRVGDVVRLVAEHSGQCVSVYDARSEDGANIAQAPCKDVDHQRFRLIDRGEGRLAFQALHTNKCIAVRPGTRATRDKQNIEQQPCDSSDTLRMFVPSDTSGDPATLRNVGSSHCMDVSGASKTAGANIQQRTCSEASNQQFAIETVQAAEVPVVEAPLAAGEFDIVVSFASPVSASVQQAFERAASRWESIIVGDLPNSSGGGTCGKFTVPSNVDDVVIFAESVTMDGRGGILGSAGPCRIRGKSQGYLPIAGSMSFDSVDLAAMDSASLENVIMHEMGHVLGIGTLWDLRGHLKLPTRTNGVGADTHFNGPAAIEAFDDLGGTSYTGGAKVPVENTQGGSGTLDGHWRESVFVNELMTGFLNSGANPLSAITIGSLSDLGYDTRLEAADAFSWPVSSFRADEEATPIVEDLLLPLQIVEDDGELVDLGER